MQTKVLLFAGTVEGRQLAEYLTKKSIPTVVCVATSYAEQLFGDWESTTVQSGRLSTEEMVMLIQQTAPVVVIDATHPYADCVTENIKQAVAQAGVTYLRLLRPSISMQGEDVHVVATMAQAVDTLKTTTGNIFVTTGSKELDALTQLPDYQQRVFARVLSLPDVVSHACQIGFQGSHLIAMQGPFSTAMNVAMFQQTNADILLTKESGTAGGFEEKLQAAKQLGMSVVVIGRPTKETGLDLDECKAWIHKQFVIAPEISVVGIGMGNPETMTAQVQQQLKQADLLIGAKRMVDSVKQPHQACFYSYRALEIADYIRDHTQYQKIVVVQSGDVGFYSGTKKLLAHLPAQTQLFAGISSPIYFCAKLKMPWQEVKMASLHGVESNVVGMVCKHHRVFVLLSDEHSVSQLCEKFVHYGMHHLTIHVGEQLSYPDESITIGTPKDYIGRTTHPLCVMLIENEQASTPTALADGTFLRSKVPMTKSEIRHLSLAKLQLQEHSVVYDIGAGTGSVSVEMARQCTDGAVYAVEKNEEAIALLQQNKQRFCVDNLHIIQGVAPQASAELPTPTHAFIGGSSGNLQEIVTQLLQKNPNLRIVINAITLETITEAMNVLNSQPTTAVDICSVSVARADQVGKYHLMRGLNPVYIIAFNGGTD